MLSRVHGNITREHSCVDTGAINAACRLKLVLVNLQNALHTIHCSSARAGRRKGMTMTRPGPGGGGTPSSGGSAFGMGGLGSGGSAFEGKEHPAAAVLLSWALGNCRLK